MVLTIWLVSIGVLSISEAEAFWSNLHFPDCIRGRTNGPDWQRYA